MQAAADRVPSGMVSILGLDRPAVEALCAQAAQGEILQVASLLTPGNIAVSGTKAACLRVAEMAQPAGAMRAIPLAVAGAFHTSIMQPAVERLKAALAGAPLARPRIPVFSNVDARSHEDPNEIRRLLVEQVVSPVLWEGSQRALLAFGCDEFYEVGPGRVLRGLLKRIDRKIVCHGTLD
jgi:[acyl-carrier-protein] S-malonyltransferase